MVKNIVFDFGGVIADIDRDKAVQAFIKLGLKDAETRLDKYHQTGIFQELEEGKLTAEGFRDKLGELCRRELTMEEIGQIYGVSRMAVSKRLKKLHKKLGSSVL